MKSCKARRLEVFTREFLVDASINFEWLPTVTTCSYVQINNERHLMVRSRIETGFTWYLDDVQGWLN